MKGSIAAGVVVSALVLGCGGSGGGSISAPRPDAVGMRCQEICAKARECDEQYVGASCERECQATSEAYLEVTDVAANACLEKAACVDFQACMQAVLPACSSGSADVSRWLTAIEKAARERGGLSEAEFGAKKKELAYMGCLDDQGLDAVVACANAAPPGDAAAWGDGFDECLVVALPLFEEMLKGF